MKKARLFVFSLLVITALMCTACSKGSKTQPDTPDNTVTAEPQKSESKSETTPAASSADPEPTSDPVSDPEPTAEPTPDDSDDEILDDSGLSGNEEYFTSLDDIVGVWGSDYVDRALSFYDDGTFGFVYADSEGTEIDGTYAFIDVNYVVLSFNDNSGYDGNMNLYVLDYDTMGTDDVENFVRMSEDDLMGYDEGGEDHPEIDTVGMIGLSFTTKSGEPQPALDVYLYDENGTSIDYLIADTYDDGSLIYLYSIDPGTNPVRLDIMSHDPDPTVANGIWEDLECAIEMTHGTEDETDFYSTSLEYLPECYIRSYTGIWYYSVPIDWYGLYLSDSQAG